MRWTDDRLGQTVTKLEITLCPRDLVFRPDNMDETVPHMYLILFSFIAFKGTCFFCHEADHLADTFALNRFSMCSKLELIF